jgi:hypothetical protein
MENNGYCSTYIHRFRDEINRILADADSHRWQSYQDIYLEYFHSRWRDSPVDAWRFTMKVHRCRRFMFRYAKCTRKNFLYGVHLSVGV